MTRPCHCLVWQIPLLDMLRRARLSSRTRIRPPQPSSLSLADIRAIVREELRAGLAAQESSRQDSQAQAQPAHRETPEHQQFIYEEISQLIQRAIGYGTWTQEDRQHLRGVLHKLTVPQQDQVIGELFGAIQSGRLKVSGEGTPL